MSGILLGTAICGVDLIATDVTFWLAHRRRFRAYIVGDGAQAIDVARAAWWRARRAAGA